MLNLKKFFICFILALMLFSSITLATDNQDDILLISTENTNTSTAASVQEDLYIYNTDSYTLNDIVYGNVFTSTNKFVTNPKNNGGIVYGNLFLVSSEVIIGSDVTYSNNKDKNDNYLIDSINSHSVINGNVYALSDSFTLEAGSEIYGDLYVASTKVTIEPNAVVYGNIFITANDINLNGQTKGSVYITAENFNMNYYSYIEKDLYLNATNINLQGVIFRNAFITAYNDLVTTSDFKINQNLSVDMAINCTLSGTINGNVSVNTKNLTLKNDADNICVINGNLNYATEKDMQIPDGIVAGTVTTSKFVDNSINRISISSLMLSFFVLLVYVFAVVFLSKKFAPNAMKKLSSITVKNLILNLVIGVISIFAIFVFVITLLLTGVGVVLALFALVAYLFLLGLVLPLFLNQIAELLNFKLNAYVKLLVVTVVFYLISLIPTLGSTIVFISALVGIGQILFSLFKKQ